MKNRTVDSLAFVLSNNVQPISQQPTDFSNQYYNDWLGRRNGTLMPTSPGVDWYHASYFYNDFKNTLDYTIRIKWKPIVHWLIDRIEPWQVTHRSRGAVLAFSPLRHTEQLNKVQRIKEWYNLIEGYRLSDHESYRLYDAFMSMTLDAMELDFDWIAKYIRKHESSSIGGGYKWRDLYGWKRTDWRSVYNNAKLMIENMRQRPGHWVNVKWGTGLRARASSLSGAESETHGTLDRSRIIQFHPVMSMLNIFLPHKKEYFSKVLKYTEEMLRVRADFYYPYVEGGNIYGIVHDFYTEGLQVNALDGKTWEATVGLLMGPAFSTLMMYIDGVPMLPSGGWHTSIVGTMANVVQNRKTKGNIVALGDDMSVFTKNGVKSNVPWVEEDPLDTKYKVTLGIAFGRDIDNPGITGLKAMSDRAKKSVPIRVDAFTLEGETAVTSSKTMQETALWAGLYMGRFGDKSLIEILKGIDVGARDYISPGEIMDEIVSGQQNTPVKDPFAWAEELGVKKVITA